MPLARIITNNREAAGALSRRLEAYGYTTEIVRPGEMRDSAAELEIELEKLESREALAKAARQSQGKQVNVLVAADCVEQPQSETERVSLSERLIETAEQARSAQPISISQDEPQRVDETVPMRMRMAAMAMQARRHLRSVTSSGSDMLQRARARTTALLSGLKRDVATNAGFVEGKWQALRKQQALSAERRREARLERMRDAEIQRSRRLLQEQEELRHSIARKRHADEERERHLQLQEQLRRFEQAQQAERRQHDHEAQLERQRLEALRLAEERERLVLERAERQQAAEQARRLLAEAAARRRQEKEQEAIVDGMAFAETNPDDESIAPVQDSLAEAALPTAPTMQPSEDHLPSTGEDVVVAPAAEPTRTRWEGEVNSPYHPGWTWAAATAGAVTVAVMLLWTAVGSRHSSSVQFEPLAPSSFLPAKGSQVQQQVPFGPVKLVIQKTRPAAAAVSAIVPTVVTPEKSSATAPAQPHVLLKPSAAKSQVVSSGAQSAEDTEPDVVVRHFTPAEKSRVPQAGQTATIKRYSDLN